MSARLVNVRLDEERIRKAQILRDRGVSLSDVMRQAIDERFAAISTLELRPDVKQIVRGLFERHPDPPGLPPRDYDVHDRRAARRAIQRELHRTHS
jgi:hypothetical protein